MTLSLRGVFFATKQSTWIASSQKTLLAMTALQNSLSLAPLL